MLDFAVEDLEEESQSRVVEGQLRGIDVTAKCDEIILTRYIGLLENIIASRNLRERILKSDGDFSSVRESNSIPSDIEISQNIKSAITEMTELQGKLDANSPLARRANPVEAFSNWAIPAEEVVEGSVLDHSGGTFGDINKSSLKRQFEQRFLQRLVDAAECVLEAKSEPQYVAAVIKALATTGSGLSHSTSDQDPSRNNEERIGESKLCTEDHGRDIEKPLDAAPDFQNPFESLMKNQAFGEVMAGLFPGMIQRRDSNTTVEEVSLSIQAAGHAVQDDGDVLLQSEDAKREVPTDLEDRLEDPKSSEGTTKILRVPIAVVAVLSSKGFDASSSVAGHIGSQDLSEHQSIRDVERDTLCINGEALSGGALGYDGVVAHIVAVEHNLLPESMQDPLALPGSKFGLEYGNLGSPVSPHISFTSPVPAPRPSLRFQDLSRHFYSRTQLEEFAKTALRAVNRTESGHWSFALVKTLCGNENLAIIVPDSNAAGPLSINITSGPVRVATRPSTIRTIAAGTPYLPSSMFGGAGGGEDIRSDSRAKDEGATTMGWGLRAVVKASTTYNIYDPDMNRIIFRIKSVYSHRLAMPLNVGSPQHLTKRGVVWNRVGSAGEVTLEIEEKLGIVAE